MSPLDPPDLVAFWDFADAPSGPGFVARGPHAYRLHEQDGAVERVRDGVFGPHAIRLGQGPWLSCPRAACPALDLHGPDAQFTVVAWLKREPAPPEQPGCQAVAGMWNEHGRRQYCLFLNLHIHDSAEQVGAHVSGVGGPTPGFKYCMDAAIGATPVPFDTWRVAAASYDGHAAYAWLDGRLDTRGDRNPYAYPAGLFDAGADGADFTVGAVARPERVDEARVAHGAVIANRYHGLLGGLAVYARALSADEIAAISRLA